MNFNKVGVIFGQANNLHNSTNINNCPKSLYKYLLRQCQKLPEDAHKYYKFFIRQSYKQHLNESDPDRIKQIISKSHSDAEWILKKYTKEIKN